MNRSGISAAALAAILTLGVGIPKPAVADPTAAQPAFRADQFTDFVGLSASPFETYLADGPFKGAGTKYPPETFFDLGIRHYRTGLKNDLTLPNAPALIGAAYDKYGAQAMLLTNGGKNASPKDVVARLKLYEPGSVDLVEGPNEVNNKFPPQNLNIDYKGMTDEAGGAAYMVDLYKLIKSDPATANIGVVAYTAIFTDYHLARPCDSFDYSNMHSYQGYNVPEASLDPNETSVDNILPSGGTIKPFVPTECGYNVQADVSNGTNGTGSLRAQALNIPMLLAEYFRHGIKRAYLFALHNADGYGLLESDQVTKRPSYYAVKNLMATIKDASWDSKTHKWTGGDFTPKALLFAESGVPSTVHTLTLEKKNGQYLLLIWNEVKNFDENAHKDIVNAPIPVTLTFSTQLAPSATVLTQNTAGGYDSSKEVLQAGKLTVDVPAAVSIIELTPASIHSATTPTAPQSVIGTATTSSIRVTWKPSVSHVAGYFLFRNGQFVTSTKNTYFDDDAAIIRPGLGYTYGVESYDGTGTVSARTQAVIVTPDRRPDLICTSVEVPTIHTGDSVVFKGILKNVGDGPTPNNTVTGLTFFIDGKYTSYATTDGTPLAPGESITLTATGGNNGGHWTATQGAHVLRVFVDDIDRVSDESNKENNNVDRSLLVDVPGSGELVGAGDPAPGQVDLTSEGTTDWIQWGLGDKAAVNRKATGGQQFSDLTDVGNGYRDATSGFGMSVKWNDGAPTLTENDTHASLWLNGVGHGYQFSAPADSQERVVKVYVGAINGAAGTLTAHLSDGSAPDYVSTTFNGNRAFSWSPVPAGFTTVFTLRYHAASPNQKLVVTWTLSDEPNQFAGQARLQAATLAISH